MIGFLPKDAALEICLRLPLTTLISCSKVCRSWRDFIRSPYFVSEHTKRVEQTHLLVRVCRPRRGQKKVREGYSLYSDDQSFDVYKRFKCPFLSWRNFFKIVSVCKGVICFSDDPDGLMESIILWNPTINKAVRLPRPNLRSLRSQHPVVPLGFGFDSATGDYKVVRMVYQVEHGRGGPKVTPQVELYTVSSGAWRNISCRACPVVAGVPRTFYHDQEQTSQAYLNGSVHWLGYRYDHKEHRGLSHSVVLFDMSAELFREIAFSDGLADAVQWEEMSIWVYREKISVALHERYGELPTCTLWIMEDYGVAESWTQLFKIDLQVPVPWIGWNRYERPLGFRNTGEFMLEKKDGSVISYDSELQWFKKLPIRRSRHMRYYKSFYVDSYTESLGLLDSGTEISYEKPKPQTKRNRETQANDVRVGSTRLKKSTKREDFLYS